MDTRTQSSLTNLSYLEVGDRMGTPVMYFHGVPGSTNEASLALPAAKEKNIRFISPDRLGYISKGDKQRSILGGWPDRIRELIDSLEIECFALL